MSTYFPLLRGRREELFALKEMASTIAAGHSIVPIIEPVKQNSTTISCFEKYTEEEMPFVFVTNPKHGDYKAGGQILYRDLCENGPLVDYEGYFPALYVNRGTGLDDVEEFNRKHSPRFRAVIYEGVPTDQAVVEFLMKEGMIYYHIVLDAMVPMSFVNGIPPSRRVLIRDNFKRQDRNADYSLTEHFTDLNTSVGNPNNIGWGDYSIVGDQFSESGGPAYAVAVHHIHRAISGSLEVSHFISDRTETTADPSGKTIEAVEKLVKNLDGLVPNDTCACEVFRHMVETQHSKGLPYLKRLSIMHHLETLKNG